MDSRNFPLSLETQQMLLNSIFDFKPQPDNFEELHIPADSYFCYYRKIVENSRAQSTTNTHRGIANLVGLLKRSCATRNSVEAILRKEYFANDKDSDETVQDLIDLAVRLLLMVSTGGYSTIGRSITLSRETKLSWKDGTVKDLVNKQFAPQNLLNDTVKLEKIFNARNLERIAGIEIRWTSNLADHLRMREDDTAVEVFHYASFLKLHQYCQIPLLDWQIATLRAKSCSVLPPALIKETISTLALLFPELHKDTEAWFEDQQEHRQKRGRLPLDPLARECGQLTAEERQISNFEYWHDRLVILKQVFDEAEPRNIKQWWCDRRKRVQWYTFWVAAIVLALTIIFGLIQCIEGALQVWLSFKALN